MIKNKILGWDFVSHKLYYMSKIQQAPYQGYDLSTWVLNMFQF